MDTQRAIVNTPLSTTPDGVKIRDIERLDPLPRPAICRACHQEKPASDFFFVPRSNRNKCICIACKTAQRSAEAAQASVKLKRTFYSSSQVEMPPSPPVLYRSDTHDCTYLYNSSQRGVKRNWKRCCIAHRYARRRRG